MKNLFLAVASLFFLSSVNGQAYKGSEDKKLDVGITYYGYGFGAKGTYDFGLSDLISVGAGAEVYFDENDDNEDRNFYAYIRSSAHLGEYLNLPWEIDVYPGIDFGLTGDGFGVGGFVGVRYFFSNEIGVFIELGTRGAVGISFDF